jgi:hypothetical protein
MHPSYSLQFDGNELTLQENGNPIMSWPAVSGRPGTQGPEHQSYRDHGPLPQGQLSHKGERDAAARGYQFLGAV